MRVIFVCSGNICRSPMAAAYMRHRAPREGLSHVIVESAGLLGIEGRSASAEAIEVLREIGVDLSGHRSRGLTTSDIALSDLTVAMTRDHLEELALRFTNGSDDRRLLREWESGSAPDPNAPDLPDPITRPIEFYREQRERLVRSIDHLCLYLRHRE